MGEFVQDRERPFEAKFAHYQATMFRIRTRRDRLFASWASDQLGEGGPPDYAEALISFAFGRKPEELIGKVVNDLCHHGVAIADIKVRRGFEMCDEQAREEVIKAA